MYHNNKQKKIQKNTENTRFYHRNGNNKKIMLNDLCPQQKAKIGQLMRILQELKNKNAKLKKNNEIIEQRNNFLLQRLNLLIDQKLSKSKEKKFQIFPNQKLINELTQKIDQLKNKLKFYEQKATSTIGIQTLEQIKIDKKIQTKCTFISNNKIKKGTNQSKLENLLLSSQPKYPSSSNYSKSFSKIMKNLTLKNDGSFKNHNFSNVILHPTITSSVDKSKIRLGNRFNNNKQEKNLSQQKMKLITYRKRHLKSLKSVQNKSKEQAQTDQYFDLSQLEMKLKLAQEQQQNLISVSEHNSVQLDYANLLLKQKQLKRKNYYMLNDNSKYQRSKTSYEGNQLMKFISA